jgi:hypothetical protein
MLTGARIWKLEMITAPLTLKTKAGHRLQSTCRRHLVVAGDRSGAPRSYVTTGNGFSGSSQPLTDAVVAST